MGETRLLIGVVAVTATLGIVMAITGAASEARVVDEANESRANDLAAYARRLEVRGRFVDSVVTAHPSQQALSMPDAELMRVFRLVLDSMPPEHPAGEWLNATRERYIEADRLASERAGEERRAKELTAALGEAGCASPSRRKAQEAIAAGFRAEAGHIACGSVRIGMTDQQARMSWGAPEDVNRTTYSFGVHEQWVYRGQNYLYFEDGLLVTIQN